MLAKLKQQLKDKKQIVLKIKAKPGMPKTKVRQVMVDGTIKIDIAAPAQKGKANQELINFLAKELGVVKKCIGIISGQTDKLKLVKINLN